MPSARKTRIVIQGAAGRMGRRLFALASEDRDLAVVAALEAAGHPRLGEDAGAVAGIGPRGLTLGEAFEAEADVIVDFSTPAGTARILDAALDRGLALLVATTGLDDALALRLDQAAERIALLVAPNTSLAVNLAMLLARKAAAALKDQDADVEIIERHHRFKEDAPSGTALKFGAEIAAEMGQIAHRHGREGRAGKRPHGEIGYHAVRGGDNPGEHTILFALPGESVELSVKATSRDCYAAGALAAAKFLAGKPPGRYAMADVLALR